MTKKILNILKLIIEIAFFTILEDVLFYVAVVLFFMDKIPETAAMLLMAFYFKLSEIASSMDTLKTKLGKKPIVLNMSATIKEAE